MQYTVITLILQVVYNRLIESNMININTYTEGKTKGMMILKYIGSGLHHSLFLLQNM